MSFVLDTNVVSEPRKVGTARVNAGVAEWGAKADAATLFLSAVTILELERGILSLERRDRRQGAMIRAWMTERVLPAFDGRILPVDHRVALRCAQLHVPDPKPERDALIAATALVHGMALVTRNIADFASMGVPLLDPWA